MSPGSTESSHNMGDEFNRFLGIVCETAVRLAHVEHSYIALFDSQFEFGTICAEFPAGVGMVGKKVLSEKGFVETASVKDDQANRRRGR
jgi:hypothetical protein